MDATTRPRAADLRRIRHLDYDIVRKIGVESLTFMGVMAALVGIAFNVGLFARFGFTFISLLTFEDMVMTAFGLIILLTMFYALALACVSQTYFVYELFIVVRRRRHAGFGRVLALNALLLTGLIAAAVLLIFVFVVYRRNAITSVQLAGILTGLALTVATTAFVTVSKKRLQVLLGGAHLMILCLTSAYFGITVANIRIARPSLVTLDTGPMTAGIVLISKAGLFIVPHEGPNVGRSVFIASGQIKQIRD